MVSERFQNGKRAIRGDDQEMEEIIKSYHKHTNNPVEEQRLAKNVRFFCLLHE